MGHLKFSEQVLEIINLYKKRETIIWAVILVGSKASIKNLKELKENDSDLDVLILTDSKSYQLNVNHKGIRLDLSFVDYTDIVGLLLAALNGNGFASKIFSAINDGCIVISDGKRKIASIFIKVINRLHNTFEKACLPNYVLSYSFIHNIGANLRDLGKPDSIETFFARQRFHSQVFDYATSLMYPFQTKGSYRGVIFNRYCKDFHDKINDEKTNSVIENKIIEYLTFKYVPNVNGGFKAIMYNALIEEKLESKGITSFFFGYDNLISEKTIVFLPEEEYLGIFNQDKFKLLNISCVVPCFSKDQFSKYINLITYLSQKFLSFDLDERKRAFACIWNKFKENRLQDIIDRSVKAILVQKLVLELHRKEKK